MSDDKYTQAEIERMDANHADLHAECEKRGSQMQELAEVIMQRDRELAALRVECERLRQIKEPFGDNSESQQARAWSKVWNEMWPEIGSFISRDGSGVTRAIDFVRHLKSEMFRLRAELDAAKSLTK